MRVPSGPMSAEKSCASTRCGPPRSTARTIGGDRPSHASVRASLLALIQHSVVTVKKRAIPHRKNINRTKTIHLYEIDIHRARLFPRYPRLVSFIKKLQDETAATLVEEILVQGRLRTVQAIVLTVEQIQQQQQQDDESTQHHRYTSRQAVLESFLRLTRGGFLEQVPHIQQIRDDDDDEGETEFEGTMLKTETTEDENNNNDDQQLDGEDPTVVSLLRSGPYKNLPPTAIWRVNTDMFHEQLRAVSLGWLVAERYNHKIQSSGSIVTAALKLAASYRHGNSSLKSPGSNHGDFDSVHSFTVEKILRYLPKTVVQSFEKREGGVVPNIYKALVELTKVSNPKVVEEVEVAPGQPAQCKFQIQTQRLVEYLRDRIVHQVSFLF